MPETNVSLSIWSSDHHFALFLIHFGISCSDISCSDTSSIENDSIILPSYFTSISYVPGMNVWSIVNWIEYSPEFFTSAPIDSIVPSGFIMLISAGNPLS